MWNGWNSDVRMNEWGGPYVGMREDCLQERIVPFLHDRSVLCMGYYFNDLPGGCLLFCVIWFAQSAMNFGVRTLSCYIPHV